MKKYEIKAEIRVELTQEDIDDIMVGALEGGITYWCSEASPEGGEYLGASMQVSRFPEAGRCCFTTSRRKPTASWTWRSS